MYADSLVELLPGEMFGYPGSCGYWVGDFEDGITELGLRAFAFEVEENDAAWPYFTEAYWNPPTEVPCPRCDGSGKVSAGVAKEIISA
jgi:hypothetical protein